MSPRTVQPRPRATYQLPTAQACEPSSGHQQPRSCIDCDALVRGTRNAVTLGAPCHSRRVAQCRNHEPPHLERSSVPTLAARFRAVASPAGAKTSKCSWACGRTRGPRELIRLRKLSPCAHPPAESPASAGPPCRSHIGPMPAPEANARFLWVKPEIDAEVWQSPPTAAQSSPAPSSARASTPSASPSDASKPAARPQTAASSAFS